MSVLLPAASVARTCRVWAPSARAGRDGVGPHAVNAAPSTLHVSTAAGSETATAKAGRGSLLSAPGAAVNDAAGATVSTVQVHVAGVGSTLPIASTARTSSAWPPSARPS